MLSHNSLSSIIAVTLCLWNIVPSSAQTDNMETVIEFHGSASNNNTPLWLNANKYGLSSLNSTYGYARGTILYHNSFDKCGIDYNLGADLVLPVNFVSEGYKGSEYKNHFILQQLYAEAKWKLLSLYVGSKQNPAELHDNLLSSGAQTLGINARPIPQGRLSLDWWTIPYTRQWLSIKGHVAFGIMTDGEWEEKFTGNSNNRYNKWTRYHEKAGYLRIGNNEKFPLSLTMGLQMAAQFGGELYNPDGTDENNYNIGSAINLSSDVKSYWNAFFPLGSSGGDVDEVQFKNTEGNQLGSWVCRFDWEKENYKIGVYYDHFFEDHSAMFMLDYDGYGSGDEWNEKKETKFFAYDFKDGLWGIDVQLKKFNYIKGFVAEYLNTRYQSGPVYHDHNATNSDHICGMDNYYNNRNFSGWQHWGQAIGNPLFRSPLYNTDGYILSEANRFFAWHFGVNGDIIPNLSYRILYSWERAFGTYRKIFAYPQESSSLLFELNYKLSGNSFLDKSRIIVGVGSDKGDLRGDNLGIQATYQYKL